MARGLSKLPAEERYLLLKDWTLPTAERKSVRALVAFLAESQRPARRLRSPSRPLSIPPGGIIATPLLLIEAARQAGKLDELANELRGLDEKSVDEARPLLVLVEIARGKGADVIPKIEAMAADLESVVDSPPTSNGGNSPQNVALPPPPLVWFLVAGAACSTGG